MANYNSPPNKRIPTAEQLAAMVAAYEAGDSTTAIGKQVGASGTWVAERLKEHGVALRRPGAKPTPLDTDAIRSAYVERHQSITSIAQDMKLPYGAVRKALADQGIPIRKAHTTAPCDELRRLYADQQMTPARLAKHFGLSRSAIYTSLDRCGIERHSAETLDITDDELQIHLDAGLTDIEIANQYRVAAWNVRQRCRDAGLTRPPGGRFVSQIPVKPDDLDLQLAYITLQRSLSDIATEHKVTTRVVKLWLADDGIPTRDAGRNTRPGHSIAFSATQLADLYENKGWTTDQIAAHLGRSKKSVIFALHSFGVPLRRPGAGGPREQPLPLLTALYNDNELCDTLTTHNVAIVKRFGTPAERFPTKPELTDVLVAALYDNHGLSITQIELLTGHTATAIRHTTQTAGLALRSGGRSPWTLEHLNGS